MPYNRDEATDVRHITLISKRARREPKLKFTSLAHLLNIDFLRGCYFSLGKDRASGIDEISWQEYGEQLEENLCDLVTRMKSKRYKPLPAKRVYIPKGNNEERPLGLPSLEDKIVQKGIAKILEAIYEADFLHCSYGFRPSRSCHHALKSVDNKIFRKRVNHVIEADIKGFFDNVSHEWLIKFLKVRIDDPSFLLLISRFLKAGYVEEGQLVLAKEGTPQGGNLSPILSNIFLHYVLDLWFEAVVKTYVNGECYMVRYADDFICMVQNDNDAKRIEQALRNRFERFGLELHPEKTRTISFGRFEKERAQKQKRRSNTFNFLGFTHYCGKSRKGTFIVGRKTSQKKFRQKLAEITKWLKDIRDVNKCKLWWATLIAKLRGHYQYYGVSGNSRSLNLFYYKTEQATFKWLNRCSQKTRFNWKGFAEYLKHYPLPKPRIMNSFY